MLSEKYQANWTLIIRDISWAVWNRLGLMGTGGENLYSIDIEAALLLGAVVMRQDARLYEGIYSWIKRYENIINGERLATLIRRENNETIARIFGGLLESGQFTTLNASLKACEKMCSTDWKIESLFVSNRQLVQRKPSVGWKNWGFLAEEIEPRKKIEDHEQIIKNNAGIRYRCIYGVSLRADILYLLSISNNLKKKTGVDHLTTANLAGAHLGCDRSTVYRIQKDLEEGGILKPQKELKNQYIVTWAVKDPSCFLKTMKQDVGIIRWIVIKEIFFNLFRLIDELENVSDESIAKYRISNFHSETFPNLADHGIEVPSPYGGGLGPLKNYRLDDLADMTTQALRAFYTHITKNKV